jgi:hypothetical protein
MQLLQNLAAGFRPVLPFGVILRSFLNSVAVLHQILVLPITVSTYCIGQAKGHTTIEAA